MGRYQHPTSLSSGPLWSWRTRRPQSPPLWPIWRTVSGSNRPTPRGQTQIYSQALQANCDAVSGAVMDFFIPEEMRIINKVLVKVRMTKFRAYSKSTQSDTSKAVTSTTSNDQTRTSSDGGRTTATSSDGGGQTTSSGGGATSSETSIESSSILPNQTTGRAVHNHGLRNGVRLTMNPCPLEQTPTSLTTGSPSLYMLERIAAAVLMAGSTYTMRIFLRITENLSMIWIGTARKPRSHRISRAGCAGTPWFHWTRARCRFYLA